MNGSLIGTAAIATIVPLVLTWLLNSRTSATVRGDGTAVLAYPGAWRGFVYVFALVPPAIAVLAALSPPKSGEAWIPGAMALGFAALVAPLGWEVFRFRLEAGPTGIVSFSPWLGRREMLWADVVAMDFNPAMMWYAIQGRTGATIRVSHYASGVGELKAMMAKRGVRVPVLPAGV